MPFWQQVQRCENCRFWRARDPNDSHGYCDAEAFMELPEWASAQQGVTHFDDGQKCPAYKHDAHKSHPLDRARGVAVAAQIGDKIPMRTYERGKPVSRTSAEVLHHSKHYVTVSMLNGRYRIRLDGAEARGHRPCTVVGMEAWGVDPDGETIRRATRTEHPERAEQMLKRLKPGDSVPVIGYPPFDGITRRLTIVRQRSTGDFVVRMNSKRTARMYRKGPLAGIIEGEVFCLDTTGESDATPTAPEVDTPAEGHAPV